MGDDGPGSALASPGDVNADGYPDYFLAGDAINGRGGVVVELSQAPPINGLPALPAPPAPVPASAAAPRAPAKRSLARARLVRRDRVIDVLAPISRRASGDVDVELHAAGIRHRFSATVDSGDGRIRFRRSIPAAQARLGTGIVTVAYPGDADTRPQEVRLRAAAHPAALRLTRPAISGGRLKVNGAISSRARGVVRLQLQYVVDKRTVTLRFRARIANGRWSLDERLTDSVRAAISRRDGTVQSYTLFTGYLPRRIRGEMRAFQVLGPA
jgi:hypothetical protein